MKKSPRLVFFGNERLVSGLAHTDAPVLRALIAAGYDIAAVVSNHTEAQSRKSRPLEVAEVAREHDIPVLLPDRLSDIEEDLRRMQADAAVLVAYGKIISQRIINVFGSIGIINIHPSLLPRHRGPTPIESTILMGDKQAGVSIMQLTAGMDEGPVYAQDHITLTGYETKQELYVMLSRLGTDMLTTHLPAILSGALQPKPQRNGDVSYTSLLTKQDGRIDQLTDTAEVIERKVRAYADFPKSRLLIDNNDVIVTMSKVVTNNSTAPLVIECAQNTWLEIVELIGPSGKRMSGDAYVRGYRSSQK